MELIATHIGADFDAFASMSIARRFHPGARLFFPGSREESVRRMLESKDLVVDEIRQRHVNPSTIRRIILCDTRQRNRVGVIGTWLERYPAIEVLAYDHHPDSDHDVPVTGGVTDTTVGATSTLIAERLALEELAVTPDEATLLLLGIYEDTGALTYATTSARDHRASAWLLERGGELSVVRRFALHSPDAMHLDLLHRMTHELSTVRVAGHRVGLIAVELGRYVEELAPLVSRTLELFDLPLLVACFGEGDRVTVIARGRLEGFDLGRFLAEAIGGGGHATAAAGNIKEITALEARELVLDALRDHLPPAGTAADLMNRPFVTVPANATVADAKGILLRSRVNAAPVADELEVKGSVSRQVLDAALQHNLGDRPVAAVLDRQVHWVDPKEPAEELARRMSELHPRFLLVGDPEVGLPIGLVTRMAVLQHLYGRLTKVGEAVERRSRERPERRRRVAKLVSEGLPTEIREQIEVAARVADATGQRVYLVGGFVRDLLLGRDNRDIDLVVCGDGPAFARELGRAMGARVRVHEPFMTAVVKRPDGEVIDVATARSEFYREPAALPEVRTSALRQDLYRRDFTVNTLAVELGSGFELIDYFGGQQDIEARAIRVLHSLSFIDDPTRVLRAIRLELRLGFTISVETQRLIGVALEEGVFDRLSGERLRDELRLLLDDPDIAVRGIERLEELGLLGVLHPDLRLGEERVHQLREIRAAWSWYRLQDLDEPPAEQWRLLLFGLTTFLPPEGRAELTMRLVLTGAERRRAAGLLARLEDARLVLDRPGVAAHEVRRALARLEGEETLLLMAGGGSRVQGWVRRDLEELRRVVLRIGGGDLVEEGHDPGPDIGLALAATLDARVDGRIGADGELSHALDWLARHGPDAAIGAPPREDAV